MLHPLCLTETHVTTLLFIVSVGSKQGKLSAAPLASYGRLIRKWSEFKEDGVGGVVTERWTPRNASGTFYFPEGIEEWLVSLNPGLAISESPQPASRSFACRLRSNRPGDLCNAVFKIGGDLMLPQPDDLPST